MPREKNQIRVLVCDRQPHAFEEVDQATDGETVITIVGWVSNSEELHSKLRALKPDVLVLDMDNPGVDPRTDMRKIYVENLPVGEVVILSDQDTQRVRAAMRLGAEDFQIRPVAPESLALSIINVFKVVSTRHPDGWKDEKAAPEVKKVEGTGKLIGITSGKAGVGKTTIATNLTIAIANETHKKVALLDLDHGDCSLLLDLHPERSLVEVADTVHELDPQSLEEFETKHNSSIVLIVGTNDPDTRDLDILGIASVTHLFSLARLKFDFTIISFPVLKSEEELQLLGLIDDTLCVTTGRDLMDMRATRSYLSRVRNMDSNIKDRMKIVANFVVAKRFIGEDGLGKALGFPIAGTIADDELVADSVNTGHPFVVSASASQVAGNVAQIARKLLGLQTAEGKPAGWKFW